MVVVGCCVVPSWPGVLDLDLPDLPDSAQQLHVAAKYIGDHVADLKPDMIVLISHRGVSLSDSVSLVTGHTIAGTASFTTQNTWADFSVSANLADDVARDLVEVLEKRQVECCLVSMEGLGETVSDGRLGWGEVTPLWFLSEARGTSGTRRRVLAQDLLILSPPRPRNIQSDISDLLEHCVMVGEEVGEVLDQFEQRVMIVLPGDLSPGHRPCTDLPALQPPASLLRRLESSERGMMTSRLRRAALFDDHMELWVRNLSRSGLVERAVNIAVTGDTEDLLPDSLPSFAVLQGLAQRCGMSGEVLARAAPSYLGLIAAIFHNNEKGFKLLRC